MGQRLSRQQLQEQDERLRQLPEIQRDATGLNRTLYRCQRENPRDWVIKRNEIRITDQRLGGGAWGNVFVGKFRGTSVAVKKMHKQILSPYTRELFMREVEIASQMRHPCLLQFIGATIDVESPLLVTEIMLCSLRERLYHWSGACLSEQEIAIISLDVARALNYLHEKPKPMIHHDISSANVLLRRQSDQWRAKVSDYGSAYFARQSTRNDAGAVIYCAPESLTKDPDWPISCKVDVYSFGVLLCEVCIRQLPSPKDREMQISHMEIGKFRNIVESSIISIPGMRTNMMEIVKELEPYEQKELDWSKLGELKSAESEDQESAEDDELESAADDELESSEDDEPGSAEDDELESSEDDEPGSPEDDELGSSEDEDQRSEVGKSEFIEVVDQEDLESSEEELRDLYSLRKDDMEAAFPQEAEWSKVGEPERSSSATPMLLPRAEEVEDLKRPIKTTKTFRRRNKIGMAQVGDLEWPKINTWTGGMRKTGGVAEKCRSQFAKETPKTWR